MYKTLTMKDRAVIKKLWDEGIPVTQIAKKLKCSTVCIYAELHRGKTDEINSETLRRGYCIEKGAQTFIENCKRRGNRKSRK